MITRQTFIDIMAELKAHDLLLEQAQVAINDFGEA